MDSKKLLLVIIFIEVLVIMCIFLYEFFSVKENFGPERPEGAARAGSILKVTDVAESIGRLKTAQAVETPETNIDGYKKAIKRYKMAQIIYKKKLRSYGSDDKKVKDAENNMIRARNKMIKEIDNMITEINSVLSQSSRN